MSSQPCYRNQFLAKRSERTPDDGRDLLDAELRKIHRAGPTRPDVLNKRAPDTGSDDAIRKMTLTNADRAARSNDDAALQAVRKCLRRPSGRGLFLPVDAVRKGRDVGRLVVSDRDLTWMSGCGNLRKVSPALPAQSSNAFDPGADASRAGASSAIADQIWPAIQSGPKPFGPPASASMSSRGALPTDKRKGRADEDEDEDRKKVGPGFFGSEHQRASLDSPTRKGTDASPDAIKSAHRAGPSRGW